MNQAPLYESLLSASQIPTQAGAPAPKIRPSAAIVPWRRVGSGELQVYWARRSPGMRFMGGWHAFPGGGLSRIDADVPVIGTPVGADLESFTSPIPGQTSVDRGLAKDLVPGLTACALRELFEETGLWVANREVDPRQLSEARERLLKKELSMAEILDSSEAQLDGSRLVFAGRWLTPPFAPVRFDNRFFLLHWPCDQANQPTLMGGELEHGEWIAPDAAYRRWLEGEVTAAPPILHILKVMAELGPDHGHRRLCHTDEANLGPFRRIEFRPGVILLPLRTPTLPPADHTNCFLLGRGDAVLVDPATPFDDEQDRLLAALDAAKDQGYRIREIWLTHHHPDHVGAVERVRQHLKVPVMAHERTAQILKTRGIEVQGRLFDGQRVKLDGAPEIHLSVHHTPGHAGGHLCFFDETFRTLIAGDLISTLSTIVIDPPDGNMSDYLASLEKMARLDAIMMLPCHGPATLAPRAKLEEYITHRLQREAMVLKAHQSGKTTAQSMVAEVYSDVPEWVYPVAVRQIEAHLIRLRTLGQI